jgi:hypothetical protein
MTPESLSRMLQEFLGGSRHAVVLEDGARIFDLADSKYSVSGEYNKCLLHLWSAERNAVRRILDTEVRNGTLRLMVQKLGHARPSKLEICRGLDHRTPRARRATRSTYQQQLRRALERNFPGLTIAKLSNAMDLERSFGPIYTRGILRQGRTAFAVLGVNQEETQASIDAALTFAILWQGLDYWSRVEWHHARGEFQRYGYFPERELSEEATLLFLVAPTLHIHPATDTVLRYISPEIEWTLIGIDERWREGVRVIFRKRSCHLAPWQRALQPDSLAKVFAD